jgi:hypothetical protein
MAGSINRRLLVTFGGGVVVLVVALGGAIYVVRRDHGPRPPPPASAGGLVVQMGRSDDAKVDPKRPLRCFVNGQLEGLETLADCAKKNGVATEALDVGVDQTGALAAANQAGPDITPLPPAEGETNAAVPPGDAGAGAVAAAARGPTGECWRYAAGNWRKVGDGLALNACVQLLFAGHCEKPGGASYGRWMGQTIRLVPHRVEISSDNKVFRTVVEQVDTNCAIPDF